MLLTLSSGLWTPSIILCAPDELMEPDHEDAALPVIAEVHTARDQHAARFNYDVKTRGFRPQARPLSFPPHSSRVPSSGDRLTRPRLLPLAKSSRPRLL